MKEPSKDQILHFHVPESHAQVLPFQQCWCLEMQFFHLHWQGPLCVQSQETEKIYKHTINQNLEQNLRLRKSQGIHHLYDTEAWLKGNQSKIHLFLKDKRKLKTRKNIKFRAFSYLLNFHIVD